MLLTLEITGFFDSLLMSVIAIAIVFIILELIVLTVNFTTYITSKFSKKEKEKEITKEAEKEEAFSMENIKDEDMMAAALVATIDYHNEIKKDVRVTNIKEIK